MTWFGCRSCRRSAKVRAELQRAVDFIQDNLAADLSLDAIAREAGLSSYHFARLFTEAFGVAPHQYVIQARIERAKSLIIQNRLSLGEAAQHAGFADQSHFTRHFKRIVGVTPRAFARGTGLQYFCSAKSFSARSFHKLPSIIQDFSIRRCRILLFMPKPIMASMTGDKNAAT